MANFCSWPIDYRQTAHAQFLGLSRQIWTPPFFVPPPPVHIIISKYVDPRALIFLRPPCMLSTKAEIQKGQGLSFQGLHGGSKYFGGANIMLQATPPGCLAMLEIGPRTPLDRSPKTALTIWPRLQLWTQCLWEWPPLVSWGMYRIDWCLASPKRRRVGCAWFPDTFSHGGL